METDEVAEGFGSASLGSVRAAWTTGRDDRGSLGRRPDAGGDVLDALDVPHRVGEHHAPGIDVVDADRPCAHDLDGHERRTHDAEVGLEEHRHQEVERVVRGVEPTDEAELARRVAWGEPTGLDLVQQVVRTDGVEAARGVVREAQAEGGRDEILGVVADRVVRAADDASVPQLVEDRRVQGKERFGPSRGQACRHRADMARRYQRAPIDVIHRMVPLGTRTAPRRHHPVLGPLCRHRAAQAARTQRAPSRMRYALRANSGSSSARDFVLATRRLWKVPA